MDIEQFIKDNHLSMTAKRVDSNPNMEDTDMDHWLCTIGRGPDPEDDLAQNPTGSLKVPFSMGYGHNGAEPELADVLDCLASDAASVENAQSFEDWASDMGWDTDSRKAERTFRTCEEQAETMKTFLGEDAYETLLWDIERL